MSVSHGTYSGNVKKLCMAAAGCNNNPASKEAFLKDKSSADVLAVFIIKPSLCS